MTWPVLRVFVIAMLFCLVGGAVIAQNTKGDRASTNRDTRFSKNQRKEQRPKRVKAKRSASLRAYKPRKQGKGGEHAGKPLYPPVQTRPTERPRNVFPNRGRWVNNKSQTPPSAEHGGITRAPRRVVSRGPARSSRNVYPQSGRYVNYSSRKPTGGQFRPRYVNYSSSDRTPGKKRRISPRSASRSFTARRSINAWANFPRAKGRQERAYKGDISGRPIRTRNFESKKPETVRIPGTRTRSVSAKLKRSGQRSARVSGVRSQRTPNVYPQTGKFVNNPSRKPGNIQRAVSNRTTLARLSRLQDKQDRKPPRKRKVAPRSASKSFIARKSPNTWAHFPRPKKKGERAVTTDLAGHPLRKKNFRSPRQESVIPPPARYDGKRRIGDQPYRAGAPRYKTASRPARAWSGDITGRRIRGRNYRSRIPSVGQPSFSIPPPGMRGKGLDRYSGNIRGRRGLRVQGETYEGNIKLRRPLKGGGSLSGRAWNNQGRAVMVRPPGVGAWGLSRYRGFIKGKRGYSPQGESYTGNIKGRRGYSPQGETYTGNIKAGRAEKGGGTRSGSWNNKGKSIMVRQPGIGAWGLSGYRGFIRARKGLSPQGEGYEGNIKSHRPAKGGGSISGKLWNNRQSAIAGRTPGIGAKGIDIFRGNIRGRKGFSPQGETYTGNIKGRKGFSPQGETYTGNIKGRKGFSPQGETYSGNIKTRRPEKGGGSISFRSWNNQERAIPGRTPGIGAKGVEQYRGNIRGRRGFSPQGETYTGNIKTKRPEKGGGSISGKLWNNKETPIPSRTPSGVAMRASGFPGKIKRFELSPGFRDQGEEYTGNIKTRRPQKGGGSVSGKLWNNKETPIPGKTPKNDQGEESLGKLRLKRNYVQNPNASELAIMKLKPAPNAYRTAGLQVRVKQRAHGQSKSAHNDALDVYSPGKAFARATDYQGNIKMKKFDLFGRRDLHPDARFVKTNKNNVASERDMLTNFKLWWARLFKKNDNQPDHLKDRTRKPRYDKGEVGLWYD